VQLVYDQVYIILIYKSCTPFTKGKSKSYDVRKNLIKMVMVTKIVGGNDEEIH